tara:strand:- start:5604 stop:5975 length:372 start_codon:yes stop_codon:yes gene_type:complete
MLADQSRELLSSFSPGFNLCFWKYSEDQNLKRNLEVLNYLTDLEIDIDSIITKPVHYVFYQNFDHNKLFVVFNKVNDINTNYLESSFRNINVNEDKKILGLNTKNVEDSLLKLLSGFEIKSVD